jgi:hypothetical protein
LDTVQSCCKSWQHAQMFVSNPCAVHWGNLVVAQQEEEWRSVETGLVIGS